MEKVESPTKVLMILEIGQKQSFIFENKEVKKNITNSNLIRWVTDPMYFKEAITSQDTTFNINECLVYSGGGHTVLEFPSLEKAKKFANIITKYTLENFNGLSMYVKTNPYDDNKTPGENIRKLISDLEHKKEMRTAYFQQGSFGIEKIDTNTKKIELAFDKEYDKNSTGFIKMQQSLEASMSPKNYELVKEFSKLGNDKGQSSFIAVVHIDGNNMGKRVQDIHNFLDEEYKKDHDWQKYKNSLKKFSNGIDQDFQTAYHEMVLEIETIINKKGMDDKQLKLNDKYFPIRRIITAGDDICYVSEGRIGIESAVMFLNKLEQKKNCVDDTSYRACAGVAIVPTKYPFFKAYELAEQLCGNAKRFASVGVWEENKCSAIDWHMEYGEVKDSLKKIRMDYVNAEGSHMELRPYFIGQTGHNLSSNSFRNYINFKKQYILEVNAKVNDGILVKSILSIHNEKGTDIASSMQNANKEYILPGSSIKGVLRNRVEMIAEYLGDYSHVCKIIFGMEAEKDDQGWIGNSFFCDSVIKNPKKINQTHIHIDKFTGGTFDGGLFQEELVCGELKLKIHIKNGKDAKKACGLFLLALRDVALKSVGFGSGASVGHGFLDVIDYSLNIGNETAIIHWANDKKIENEPLILDCLHSLKV